MPTESLVQLDTNLDDLDPRLIPRAIDQLLAAGALDAWTMPILMKKGRPAFLLSALVANEPDAIARVRDTMFRETTTLGIRESTVVRHSLDRRMTQVDVDGHEVAVKVASLTNGDVVNVSVEWDDVERIADATGRAAADILAEADAAARAAVI